MMNFLQHPPPQRPNYEVIGSAYAAATGLGHALRATDEFARHLGAGTGQPGLDELRIICEETRNDSLELADLLWDTYWILENTDISTVPSAKPFQRMLEEMREGEAELDKGMARYPVIRDVMMPLRRATAKARSNASLVVNVIRQKTPGAQTSIPSKADPEGLRELARVNTRLLRERFG